MSDDRALRRELADLRDQLKRANAIAESQADLSAMLERCIDRIAQPTLALRPPKNPQQSRATACLMLGDWHTGARIRKADTSGRNEYSLEIERRRIASLLSQVGTWAAALRGIYRIDELVVLGLADMVDGLIHMEGMIYAEIEPVRQVVVAASLLADTIAQLTALFPKVTAEMLDGDNHSRLTKKPFFAQRGLWSLGHLVNEMAKLRLANCERVTFRNYVEAKTTVNVGQARFLIQHGNDIKSYSGLPYYGFMRALGREALRAMEDSTAHWDWMAMGHFHHHVMLPRFITNGSLCGTSPFESVGMSIGSDPCQVGFVITGQRQLAHPTAFVLA